MSVQPPFSGSFLIDDDPIFDERNLAHFPADLLFLTEQITDGHLALFDTEMVHCLQQEFFLPIPGNIDFYIAHGLTLDLPRRTPNKKTRFTRTKGVVCMQSCR
jgi:hypothetical protein